jgi:hypothetical protein
MCHVQNTIAATLVLVVFRILDAIPVTISLRNSSGKIEPSTIYLHTPSDVESTRICSVLYAESCEHLMLQTHRSLKSYVGLSVLDSLGVDKDSMQATKVLAASYGIESCPSSSDGLDVCMLGNVPKDMLVMAITSCHYYRFQVFFSSISEDMSQFMYALRVQFPGISIQWMAGTHFIIEWHMGSNLHCSQAALTPGTSLLPPRPVTSYT